MSGWEVPDDLVTYAARILWVRTSCAQSTTSGQLDDLLTMYEWAHRAARRGEPWLAPEYRAIDLTALGPGSAPG
jgi:hypothetical protein